MIKIFSQALVRPHQYFWSAVALWQSGLLLLIKPILVRITNFSSHSSLRMGWFTSPTPLKINLTEVFVRSFKMLSVTDTEIFWKTDTYKTTNLRVHVTFLHFVSVWKKASSGFSFTVYKELYLLLL